MSQFLLLEQISHKIFLTCLTGIRPTMHWVDCYWIWLAQKCPGLLPELSELRNVRSGSSVSSHIFSCFLHVLSFKKVFFLCSLRVSVNVGTALEVRRAGTVRRTSGETPGHSAEVGSFRLFSSFMFCCWGLQMSRGECESFLAVLLLLSLWLWLAWDRDLPVPPSDRPLRLPAGRVRGPLWPVRSGLFRPIPQLPALSPVLWGLGSDRAGAALTRGWQWTLNVAP